MKNVVQDQTVNGISAVSGPQTLKSQTITLNGGTQVIDLTQGSTIIITGSTASSTISFPALVLTDTWFRVIDQTTVAWTRSPNGGTLDGSSGSTVVAAGSGNAAYSATGPSTWVTMALNPSGAVSKGAIVGGDTITGSTAETVMGNVKTFAANEVTAGQVWELFMVGLLNVDAATPGTLTLRARWGGVGGTQIAINDSITTLSISTVAGLAFVHATIEFLTTGASGSLRVDGRYSYQKQATAALTMGGYFGVPGSTSTTVDTTASKDLCFTVQFSSAGSTNTNAFTVRQCLWTRKK